MTPWLSRGHFSHLEPSSVTTPLQRQGASVEWRKCPRAELCWEFKDIALVKHENPSAHP